MVTARLKSLPLLACVFVTLILVNISAFAQNPAGIWKFNEGSGDTAYDSSGSGRAALLSGGVRWSKTGNTWALSSERGRPGYVTIPALNLSHTKAVTVTLWVKRLYTSNSGGVLFEAGKDYQRSDSGFALLPDDETCHGMQAVLRGNEGTTANCYAQPTSGVWHQIAAVYDKSQTGGNAIVLYIDGVVQAPTWNLSSATNTNNFGNNPVYLLSRGGNSQFTQGTISDFRVYDGALSEEEIQQTFNETMLASPASISYVQGNYADPQTSQTSLSVPFSAAQTAGDLNVVVIGWKDSRATITQVTDSKGNTYARGVGPTIISGATSQSIYYAKNISAAGAGTNTVTVTFSMAAAKPDVRIAEYSGVDPTNPVDVTAAASGSGRTASSGNATTTNANDLIVGANTVVSITSGPGSGYTKRLLSSPQGNILEDQAVSRTGSYSATAPLSLSGKWIMQMMAFRSGSATLQSITVTPANPSIAAGGHQQFTATGNYSDGSHQDLTSSATWSSSNQSVATITSTGYATGVATGTTTIKAVSGSISGTTTLTVTAAGTFTITASPTSLSVTQGNQGTSTITTTLQNGFSSSISLSASGTPSGTSVTFNPNPIPSPGSGNSTMTITVGSSTPAGTYPITVTGNGGGVQQSATVTLTVVASGGSGITLDGNLHGVQDSGQQATNSESLTIGTPHAGDLLTCEVSFDSGNGNTLTSVSDPNNGTYAAAVPMHLNSAMRQWFGIYYVQNAAASPTTVTIRTSQTRSWLAISCQAWRGAATSNVLDTSFGQLQDASGMPNPTTGTNRTPAANGELIVAGAGLVNGGLPGPGTHYALIDGAVDTQWWPEYWIQGTATSTAGNFTWPSDTWTDLMAAFKPATTGSGTFSISASPSSITVAQGNQGTSTITTTVSGGFNNSISLSASGVPSGTSVAFNPSTIGAPGNGSSTMTVTVGASTPAGTYPISVTGNGGGVQQSTTVTLTVSAGSTFSISASPSSLSVMHGRQGTSTLTTTISGGFNGAISLSASGAPSGTTISFNPTTIPAPGAGTSQMTITVGATTHMGTYPITVTATSGSLRQTVTVNLTVTAQIALTWSASQGAVGYNIYRATTSGGPYTRINSSLDSNTSYNDQAVQDGVTYYYVTTALNSQGQESTYSNQASATLP
jgi:concanavalin A-like lectin/glucanase superfamily protein/Big-like domain-containing protein